MKNILLVEDDKHTANIIKEILDAHNVTIALDGIYGLKMAKQLIPDLIVLDLNLPRMRGEEFIAKLKEDDKLKNLPIVVVSGSFATKFTGQKIDNLDADSVFSKPFDLEIFKGVVDSFLQDR